MRILHSSDWHLGQHFIGKSRADEHRALFGWLKQQIELHQVDVLIVAGDIFDTATPASYARELYHQLIVDLQSTGCQLVMLGGNHDSVAVLQEGKELLACLHTQVVPGWLGAAESHLIVLKNKQGEPGAILAALPFLRSRDVLQSQSGQQASDKQQQLQQAIADCYQQCFAKAQALKAQLGQELPLLATGHLTTVGASSSESVREIYIGSLEAFPASAFPEFDYIALGHIHQPQLVAGKKHIRYSGSPIPLSFDEAKQQKSMVLLDFTTAEGAIELLPIPCFQPLLSLKCTLPELHSLLQQPLAELKPEQKLWLELVLTGSDGYLSDLQSQVQQQLDGLPVDLLKLRRARQVAVGSLTAEQQESLHEMTPDLVLERRLAAEELTDSEKAEFQLMLQQVVAQLEQTDQQPERQVLP
ncbi:exonuclease subunit SbcD [Rheinheimera sp. MM224]|uniref:exonuclease subunit SbcD n=1 Tax=Rheinheimera sp. MM224 TaxID=3019969 RepID=UPI0021F87DDC|nr:exonuclease subunit SbcD [Rheinheimera sp. MM224]CAI3806066.1 Nuclease SbcCD subunit D [Rheinheimera sp. MM224]